MTAFAVIGPELLTVKFTVKLSPVTGESGVTDICRLRSAFVPTMKFAAEVEVPSGPVTDIGPVVAPSGTIAVILVSLNEVKLVATEPLKRTPVADKKLSPVMLTVCVYE